MKLIVKNEFSLAQTYSPFRGKMFRGLSSHFIALSVLINVAEQSIPILLWHSAGSYNR